MKNNKKLNILLVYENTGAGHKKAAEMLSEYLSNSGALIRLITVSDLLEEKQNIFVGSWNFLVKRNWLWLADAWANFFSRIVLLPFFYALYPKRLARSLDQITPDIIITTADVTRLFGSYASLKKIPFYIFITSGSIFIDMVHPHANHLVYFEETAQIIQSLHLTKYFKQEIHYETGLIVKIIDVLSLLFSYTLGYRFTPYFNRYKPLLPVKNNLKVSVLGPLREKKFYMPVPFQDVSKEYGLPSDGFNVLISNGRYGGQLVKKIIDEILRQREYLEGMTLNLIAICVPQREIEEMLIKVRENNIRLIGIENQASIAPLYQVADCSIGRGTAGILMDSLVSQTPMLVLKKITANDFGTLDLIEKYKIGQIVPSIKAIPLFLKQILTQQDEYLCAINKLNAQYNNHSLELIEEKLQSMLLTD